MTEYRKWSRNIALRVLQALDDRKMSQTDLATKMGVSRQYVSNIMKGKINFTFETVFKLQNALDIKLIKVYEPGYEEEAVHEKYLTFNTASYMSIVRNELLDTSLVGDFVSSSNVFVNQAFSSKGQYSSISEEQLS